MAKESVADLINNAIAGGTDKNTVAQCVKEFNSKYIVVNENGKALIYSPRKDRDRTIYDRMMVTDLQLLYQNKPIRLTAENGKRTMTGPVNVWLSAPTRREFIGGVVFDPSGAAPANQLNLWQGFGFEPCEGDWSLLKSHMLNIVCSGHLDQYEYLMSWMAYVIQRPDTQGEVAVVMRGVEGCGKGILARAMKSLFGQHGLHITQAKHLISNFNIHLRDCILLFADEAFFAGDKQHTGVLKALITEPTIAFEGKFQAVTQGPNYIHLMMASNESWVIPASLEARRFFALNVRPDRKDDFSYFKAISDQLDDGGYSAMLHELLHRDLSAFNVRKVPHTEGLQEQKQQSLECHLAWWLEVLHRGYVYQSEGGNEWFSQWHNEVATDLLYASYQHYAKSRNERRPLAREAFGRFMTRICLKGGRRLSNAPVGEGGRIMISHPRPMGYLLGDLYVARAKFLTVTKLTAEWSMEWHEITPEEWREGGYDAEPPPWDPIDPSVEFDFQDRPVSGS